MNNIAERVSRITFPNMDLQMFTSGPLTIYRLRTYVRIKHKGIWYLTPVKLEEEYVLGDERLHDYGQVFQRFITNCYIALKNHKIDEINFLNGVDSLDPDQSTERERLGLNIGKLLKKQYVTKRNDARN